MDEPTPEIRPDMQPDPAKVPFDLERTLSAMVSIRTEIPDDAFTAATLGTERRGHGVVIRDGGLILTIGYLIIEAVSIWMIDSTGRAIPGDALGYDQETGFGLVQALEPISQPVMEIGRSGELSEGEPVIFAGAGGVVDRGIGTVEEKDELGHRIQRPQEDREDPRLGGHGLGLLPERAAGGGNVEEPERDIVVAIGDRAAGAVIETALEVHQARESGHRGTGQQPDNQEYPQGADSLHLHSLPCGW